MTDTTPDTTDTTPATATSSAPTELDALREQVGALTQLVQQLVTAPAPPAAHDNQAAANAQLAAQLAQVDRDKAQAQPATDDPEVVALRAQLADLQKPEDPREAEIRELKAQIAALLAEKQARASGAGPLEPVRYNLMLATGEVVQADNAAGSTHHYSPNAGRSVPVTGVWLVPVDDEE